MIRWATAAFLAGASASASGSAGPNDVLDAMLGSAPLVPTAPWRKPVAGVMGGEAREGVSWGEGRGGVSWGEGRGGVS